MSLQVVGIKMTLHQRPKHIRINVDLPYFDPYSPRRNSYYIDEDEIERLEQKYYDDYFSLAYYPDMDMDIDDY